jgi:hypothetical protein
MPRSNILLRILVISAGGAFASAAPLACSSSDSPNTVSYGGAGPGGSGGNSGAGPGGVGPAGGAAGNSVGGGLFIDSGGGAGGAGGVVVDGCAQGEEQAKEKPVDMYVMFDATTTMACPEPEGATTTRFDAIKGAMQQFVNLPEANGLGVGLQFFGLRDSCNAADYARPSVPIAALPANAQPIVNALNGAPLPSGLTPLAPAVQGAVEHARAWATQTGHTVVVVLLTDGQPNLCGNASVDEIAAAAAAGLNGTPRIQTYVIGISVPDTSTCFVDLFDTAPADSIHTIAQAGGTGAALVVQTGGGAQQTAQQFLDAIKKIRERSALPCTYQIPPPTNGPIDFGKVNVGYTSGQGQSTDIYGVGTPDQCKPNVPGWYYDNPQNPSSIQLCPGTCDTVSADLAGNVKVVFGCVPTIPPPPQ